MSLQVGQTALHLAARHGRVPIVRLLLAQGADPNAQDHAGTTPLISACDRGHVNIVQILLEDTNCDINLKDKVTFLSFTKKRNVVGSPTNENSVKI